MSLLYSRFPPRTPRLHLSSCLLRLPLGCDSFSDLFFFITLIILKSSGQVFCKMSLDWDLSDDFLIVGPGDVFGEGGRRDEVAASSLLSRVDTVSILGVEVNFDHCQVLSTKLPFSLSFYAVFFGLMSLCTAHTQEVGVTFPP